MPKNRRTDVLTLETIIEVSVRTIRRQGLAGLTMRAIAADLGVSTMAVYYYVADKDELLRLVVEEITQSFPHLRSDPEQEWQDVLRRYLVDIWQNLRIYQGLASHIINQPAMGVTADRFDAGIGFFEDAGFPPAQARLAWSFAMTYIHGRISVDAHLVHNGGPTHLDGIKAWDFVEFGIDSVIVALEASLVACNPPASTPFAAPTG